MKNYRVTVNGTAYDVSVEEVSGPAAPVPAPVPAAPAAPMPVTPAPAAPVTPAAALVPPVGQAIAAPMPGVILDIKVSAGDRVTNNQVVVLLEAMKMENEIITDIEGTVTAVHVTKGSAVNAGDALISVAG